MKIPNTIGKRIFKAYLLFAVGCCLCFAIAAAVIVEGIEERLVTDRLTEIAAWASPRHLGHIPVEMPTGLTFHHGQSIPLSLRDLPDGVHDITVDGVGLHVFSGQDSAGRYVVVDHESDYESVELAVYSMLALGLFGFIAMSAILGKYMAKRFVTPIVELSSAVAERRSHLPLLENQDELGFLARAFAGHTKELKQFLDRERFFTGDVSHEMRTPLTVISGAAEVILAGDEIPPHSRAAAERIYRASQDATASVNVLLMLARSPDKIEADDFSLAQMLTEEVARFQSLVAHKTVELRFGGGDDLMLFLPRRLVAAAVGNLIRNACQYTEHGTVDVSIKGNSVVVSDSGRGLPAAVLEMLASEEMGSRLQGSEGTGLGLALVKRIAKQIGAKLQVTSNASGGTTFGLSFTIVDEQSHLPMSVSNPLAQNE